MKKVLYKFLSNGLALFSLLYSSSFSAQTYTWMKGSTIFNQGGSYSNYNVASASNNPSARSGFHTWTDANNALWLFGGNSYVGMTSGPGGVTDATNDLLKYDIASNQWIIVSGSISLNKMQRVGIYGQMYVPAVSNCPGGRWGGMTWQSGNDLWLYGGKGLDPIANLDFMNDLWKFSTQTNMWTWMGGSQSGGMPAIYGTKGIAAAANTPGGRANGAMWKDASGNFWLFGGQIGTQSSNDLWRYDVITGEWTWMHGDNVVNQPGVYGTQGAAAPGNTPGARILASCWTDNSGNFWLFGGVSASPSTKYLDDLWMYDVSSNQWTWMSGSSTGAWINDKNRGNYCIQGVASGANPGARQAAIAWTDADGNFWLFGGQGFNNSSGVFGALNDLWKYNVSINKWTWVSGTTLYNQAGNYGTATIPAASNMIGSRYASSGWTDQAGDLWIMGGASSVTTSGGYRDDLWRITLPCSSPVVTTTGTNCVSCAGQSFTLTASGASSYTWSTGLASSSIAVTPSAATNLTLSYTNQNGCTGQLPLLIAHRPSPQLSISSATSTICEGKSLTLTALPAKGNYTWSTAQTTSLIVVSPQSTSDYTLVVTDSLGCSNYATKSITVNPLPVVTANASRNEICAGENVTVYAGGASSYTWNNLAQSSASMVFSPDQTSLFFVVGSDAKGCEKSASITVTVSACTGIRAQDADLPAVFLFPNPGNGSLFLSAPAKPTQHILFFNALGQTVYESALNEGQTQITAQLPKGMYICYILDHNKQIATQKIIIE